MSHEPSHAKQLCAWHIVMLREIVLHFCNVFQFNQSAFMCHHFTGGSQYCNSKSLVEDLQRTPCDGYYYLYLTIWQMKN